MLNEKINVIDRQKLNYYDLDENVCLFLQTDFYEKTHTQFGLGKEKIIKTPTTNNDDYCGNDDDNKKQERPTTTFRREEEEDQAHSIQ